MWIFTIKPKCSDSIRITLGKVFRVTEEALNTQYIHSAACKNAIKFPPIKSPTNGMAIDSLK